MQKAVGLDIGGTKIAAGIVDETGQVQHLVKVESDIRSRDTMFAATCAAIREVLAVSQLKPAELSLGIGVPGLVDRQQGIAVFQNNLPWEKFPLVASLQKEFPEFPKIVLDNDVYQAAYGEWQAFSLGKNDMMVYLTVSTGVACSIINGGEFLRGAGFAGELGLFPVFSELQKKTARLEKLVSGPGLAEAGKELFNDGTLTAADLFQGYYAGDERSKAVIEDWLKTLGRGIYALVCILDPHKIVLGGSVLFHHPMVLQRLKEELAVQMIPAQSACIDALHMSHYENNGGVVGAGLRGIFQEV